MVFAVTTRLPTFLINKSVWTFRNSFIYPINKNRNIQSSLATIYNVYWWHMQNLKQQQKKYKFAFVSCICWAWVTNSKFSMAPYLSSIFSVALVLLSSFGKVLVSAAVLLRKTKSNKTKTPQHLIWLLVRKLKNNEWMGLKET